MSPWQRLLRAIRRTDKVLLVYIGIVLFFIVAAVVLKHRTLPMFLTSISHWMIGKLVWFVLFVPIILMSLTIHEIAHGWTALQFGDPTAKNRGRLTLNPIKHLDLVGTLMFLFVGIGWAKPVPVNPYNFDNPRRADILVSLAGPGVNLLQALVAGAVLRFMVNTGINPIITLPLLGQTDIIVRLIMRTVEIGALLAVFNLLPIPPLDGSHILDNLLPPRAAMVYRRIKSFGFIIILILMMTGILGQLIWGPASLLVELFAGYRPF
ncbi:MAG: site-2 protease family protein [bacterium]|jgi:Zn-dependent protease|nr:site-2 protease family protein [bacterium]